MTGGAARGLIPLLQRLGAVAVSMVVGFTAGALTIWIIGLDPLRAYETIARGAFGDPVHIGLTLTRTTPVLFIALSTIFAFRASIWNIGQDGQFYLGALAAAWLGVQFDWLPSYFLVAMLIIGGFLLGALWSGLAGYFKARLGMDEIVTTLMMSFIAVLAIHYLVEGPMKDPLSMAIPISAEIGGSARLPPMVPGTGPHAGFLLALAAVPLSYVLLWRTTIGYKLRAVGVSRRVAEYGGINVSNTILVTMLVSGGLSGIAGAVEISGVQYRLFVGISPGFWVLGIMAALLGRLHPAGVVLSSLFISALFVGADELARVTEISTFLAAVIQGVIILLLLATENIQLFRRKIERKLAS